MIELIHLRKEYENVTPLKDVSAVINDGRKAFYRVILPQALPHFMPVFRSEIKALIKATAVVGYVAVQDLTKMGDIVRSRTYEAFFPLIAVAVIYFVLAAILTFIVDRIEFRINPRRRTKEDILKGVTVKTIR